MIFDDHKDICITCSNSIRQSININYNEYEYVWCTEHNGIEPAYFKCEYYNSKFSSYNIIWNEVF